ncbi:RHS domain-containing protein [Pseudomonas hefeiensis]|uniref:RHS domain-containing protein n=1 Tax=Pseudomonas hefeiensis TaxID=2738125 RepID=A0ABY9GJ09_9PSED|nr:MULTISPECIES: RHS domain-containing protein [unclassified Pseudomonas]WLH15521.1 RHS domain-containing protein [Pseudomonas sp. FP205]WLI42827.1 RHS domain-containing protein [Pseudomonas sp. FP821]
MSFAYDATGQLLAENSAAGSLQHHYDELGNLIQTQLPDGRWINRLHYGSGALQKIRYYHNDLNGLPEQLTEADGHNVWRATYRVWAPSPEAQMIGATMYDRRVAKPPKIVAQSNQAGRSNELAGPLVFSPTPWNVYSQLIWVMTCYIRYTIRPFLPTRPKVAPLS